jgi:glycosyltransferase involved in cell wall biosynthesis
MAQPTVSVVIPAYNAAQFIRKTLDSVLAQTYAVVEVMVVDDGSKDDTCALVETYGGPVKLLRQKNAGPSTARNYGTRSSSGELIAYLDADDAWKPEKIEKQVKALEANPEAVLCYTGLLNFNEEEGFEFPSAPTPLAQLEAELRIRNPRIVPSSVLVRRWAFEQFAGFDPALKGSEDWDFAIAMLEMGPFVVLEEPLTLYRLASTGLSGDADHMFKETEKMLARRLLHGLSGPSRWVWRRRILSYHALTAALNARAAGKTARERHYMLQSVLEWPSPLWHPVRFKAAVVTLRNALRAGSHGGAQPAASQSGTKV